MKKAHELSNFDIMDMLHNYPHFKGCYSRDDSPYIKKNESIIINLDDSKGGGTHWCALSKSKDGSTVYYFDSFGYPPVQELVDMYKKYKNKIRYSTNQIQNYNSIMCGYYCVRFIKEFYKERSIYDIIYDFDITPTNYNEEMIKNYFSVQ